jgi:hypothetical protein
MKLHQDSKGFEGNLPENRIAMRIENSAKMFEILSSGIYKDKIEAVIREYCCNAYDAQVSAGKKHLPFTVQLPNQIDTTFAVIDEGTGIDPNEIGEIFWTYGHSTKTKRNDLIGALGLGSKSAFAYTKSSFIVRNRYKGVLYTYFCFINEVGEPSGSKVAEEETSLPDGITVEFAVRPSDISAFLARFERIFHYWDGYRPHIKGVSESDLKVHRLQYEKIIEGDGWFLPTESHHVRAVAVMGNVAYPIEADSIPNLPEELKNITNNQFIIQFPMGSLEFAASREALSYTDFTVKSLIAGMQKVRDELISSFRKKVFASKNLYEFTLAFKKSFSEMKSTFKIQNSRYTYSSDIDDEFSKFITGYSIDQYIDFNGTKVKVKRLIAGRMETTVFEHQEVCMYEVGQYRRGTLKLNCATSLRFTAKEQMPKGQYCWRSGDFVPGEEVLSTEWKTSHVPKRRDDSKLSYYDHVLLGIEHFNVSSCTTIMINEKKNQLEFVLNDVGSSGRDRFKLFVETYAYTSKGVHYVYVDFHAKVTSLETALKKTNELAKVFCASVSKISDHPDNRRPIEKAKTEKDTIKVMKMRYVPHTFQHNVGSDIKREVKTIINGMKLHATTEEIVSLTDLKELGSVPYFIVKRKKVSDDDYTGRFCANRSIYMHYSSHFGFLDDLIQKHVVDGKEESFIDVYVFTQNQVDWLIRKSVKLFKFSSIKQKAKEMFDQSTAFNRVERVAGINETNIVPALRNMLTVAKLLDDEFDPKDSFLKKLVVESNIQTVTKEMIEDLTLLTFQDLFGLKADTSVYEIAESLEEEILNKYPMLGIIDLRGPSEKIGKVSKMDLIMSYIDQRDQELRFHETNDQVCLQTQPVEL